VEVVHYGCCGNPVGAAASLVYLQNFGNFEDLPPSP